jgi:hypothetical protein
MEDFDIFIESDVEGDFINLVKNKWPKDMFIMSATAMLGNDWMETGEQILEDAGENSLLSYFKEKYAD